MKSEIRRKKIASLVLGIYFSQITFAAQHPASNLKSTRLGILPMGEMSESAGRAYALAAKRIQRWLENLDAVHAFAEPLASHGNRDPLFREASEKRLSVLSSRLWAASENSEGFADIGLEFRKLRSKLSLADFGPVIQKSLLAEASFAWAKGDKSRSAELVKKAVLINPKGRADLSGFETFESKDDADGESSVEISHHAFEASISAAESQIRRACVIQVSVAERSASIFANGVALGAGRVFRLPLGGRYHLRAESEGARSENILVECSRPAIKAASLVLKKETKRERSLAQLSRSHSVESLFLVEPDGDNFRLFLYTPGVSVDEIKLNSPWRVAELLNSPNSDSVPIATDAFLDLLGQHQSSRLSYLETPSPDRVALQQKMSLEAPSDSRWYNNWKFWAITGGVVGAAVITYLATRPTTVKSTQTGIAVTIH